ncbi:hypothetical protein [Breoghania sp.]|uniref:hypothetical protein n=1 Tax=Breoghania sp. TaxID=2065378 RepID=UPI002AAA7A0F|nr:hypothetical protein [Breoghania sp.]
MEYISIFSFGQWEFLAKLERFTSATFLAMPEIWALISFLPFMVTARLLTSRALLLTTLALGFSMIAFGYFTGMYQKAIWLPLWFNQMRSYVLFSIAMMMLALIVRSFLKSDGPTRARSWLEQGLWGLVAWGGLFFSPLINVTSMSIAGTAAEYAALSTMIVSAAAGTLTAMALILILPTLTGYLLSRFPSLSLRRAVLVVLALPWFWQIFTMLRYAGLL